MTSGLVSQPVEEELATGRRLSLVLMKKGRVPLFKGCGIRTVKPARMSSNEVVAFKQTTAPHSLTFHPISITEASLADHSSLASSIPRLFLRRRRILKEGLGESETPRTLPEDHSDHAYASSTSLLIPPLCTHPCRGISVSACRVYTTEVAESLPFALLGERLAHSSRRSVRPRKERARRPDES